MREHLRAGQWEAGLALYGGAFLDGLNLELNPDLDEWVLETREALAAQAQAALLTLARQAALELDQAGAARFAERCHTLPGAAPLDDTALGEVYGFLARANHPHAEALRREARELGLTLCEPAMRRRHHPAQVSPAAGADRSPARHSRRAEGERRRTDPAEA